METNRVSAAVMALFDYQRFADNARLRRLINDTESRYDSELSDDSLAQISAAGDAKVRESRMDRAGMVRYERVGIQGSGLYRLLQQGNALRCGQDKKPKMR